MLYRLHCRVKEFGVSGWRWNSGSECGDGNGVRILVVGARIVMVVVMEVVMLDVGGFRLVD